MEFGSNFTYLHVNKDDDEVEVEADITENLFDNQLLQAQVSPLGKPQTVSTTQEQPPQQPPQQPLQQPQQLPTQQQAYQSPQTLPQQQQAKQNSPSILPQHQYHNSAKSSTTGFFSKLGEKLFGANTTTSNSPPPPPPSTLPQKPNLKNAKQNLAKKRKVKIADTNVVSISLGNLVQTAQLATGESILCKACKSAFNSFSKLNGSVIDEKSKQIFAHFFFFLRFILTSKIWKCEFCAQENQINIDPEEVPKSDTVDYVLSVPAERTTNADDDLTVFCIDISGSSKI